ncbi:hypothetical protein GCM10009836_16690 [Pseudonocardia ailaonensis]|uniref:Uncharacterized protein n=1 Tax=Pseudonocardia ailaonensis TaxID=367279 RepID=A0ABN2MUA3_9PSEU
MLDPKPTIDLDDVDSGHWEDILVVAIDPGGTPFGTVSPDPS